MPLYYIYRLLSTLFHPFLKLHLLHRLNGGKENVNSIKNKAGYYSKVRPVGKLIWVHAASVGEAKSVLPLVNYMRQQGEFNFLITTSTISGEAIVKSAIACFDANAAKVIHQFLVLDTSINAIRFFDYWQPDLGIFIDSELWPNILHEAKKRLPMVLINARISPSSFKCWSYFKKAFQYIMKTFVVISPTTEQDAIFLKKLGVGAKIKNLGNLKQAAEPLPYDKDSYNKAKKSLAGVIFLAASTHEGEDEQLLQTVLGLGIMVIIAPRHPNRGQVITDYAEDLGYEVQRRSVIFPPKFTTDGRPKLYIVDRIGELGMWYRLADMVFIGGSLVDIGGHNIIEPAQLEKAIIIGPYTYNFSESMQLLKANDAVLEVSDVDDLKSKILMLLKDKKLRGSMGLNAAKAVRADGEIIKRCSDLILEILDNDSLSKT